MSVPVMAGPDELRAADADRQATAERLQAAAVEGRLDLDEYDRRVRSAYAAVRYGDLARLTADLPPATPAPGLVLPSPAPPSGSRAPGSPASPRAAGPPSSSLAAPPTLLATRPRRPAAAVAACLACPPAGCLILLVLLVVTILAGD